MPDTQPSLPDRLAGLFAELGIDADVLLKRPLPIFEEAAQLAPVGLGTDGRDKFLLPSAARAWSQMCTQAKKDGIDLLLVSAFRSYDYQAALIRGKLARAQAIGDILRVNAPPGCSEHHSGRAVDIGSPDCPPLEDKFEETAAFRWLSENAATYRYFLSFPRDNPQGYVYEPWHWCYQAAH